MKEESIKEQAPMIEFKNICKSYGKKIVHDHIDLTVQKGEILTLMGGSGSGKSVLLRSLIGLEKPDSGEIFFHGKKISMMSEENLVEIRKKIAYCFQYGALFDSLTIAENLEYPLREHTKLTEEEIKAKVQAALEQVGLTGSATLLPSDLSGGMQRRVGVARAIILRPEVILYDEPTTGLDPYNTRQILRIILNLKRLGATSILVTHDMSSIFAVTDRVAFLKAGKIRALGTVNDIKKSTDVELKGFISGEMM